MKSLRNPTEFDQNNRDVTPIPGHVIKKNNSRGAKHGPSERKKNYQAKHMLKKARQGKHGRHPTILSRWYASESYRDSLSANRVARKRHNVVRQYRLGETDLIHSHKWEQYTHKYSTYRVAQHDHISSREHAWLESCKAQDCTSLCPKNNCHPRVMSHSLPHLTDHNHVFSLNHFVHFSYLSDGLTFTNKPYADQHKSHLLQQT